MISDGGTDSLDIHCVRQTGETQQWPVVPHDIISVDIHCVHEAWQRLVIPDGNTISVDIHCVHEAWQQLVISDGNTISVDIYCVHKALWEQRDMTVTDDSWWHGRDLWYLIATCWWTVTLCVKHSERWQWPMLPYVSIISLCAWNVGEMWRRVLWYLMAAPFLWIFTVCIKQVTVMWLVILMAWQRLVMATSFHWTFTVGINCWWDMAETGGPVGNTVSVYLLFCAYSMGGETRQCL